LKTLIKGFYTGLFLQLAIGPVFFFILNISFNSNFYTVIFGVLAVTLVDYLYISLSILGIGKLLSTGKNKVLFTTISSLVLIIFGILSIKSGLETVKQSAGIATTTWTPLKSFVSCLILTISSPLTIVFWSSIFSAKTIELDLKKKELMYFGIGAGFATFIFMSVTMLILSVIKQSIPSLVIQVLNCLVGALLIYYGAKRLITTIISFKKATIT
jgi:threonine/homoserine/homoserine lactone efflux protein